MGSVSEQPGSELCTVVTGSNRGIGLVIARQLAEHGVTVVLTARNEKCGVATIRSLRHRDSDLCNIMFHRLDVQDPVSVACLVKFVQARFDKLDILVNSAGAPGATVDVEGLKALGIDAESWVRYLMPGKLAPIQTQMLMTMKLKQMKISSYYYEKRKFPSMMDDLHIPLDQLASPLMILTQHILSYILLLVKKS